MRVPLWLDTVSAPNYPTLTHPLDVDVCIVGAGITGVTLAYLLKDTDLKVVLIDSDHVLHGTISMIDGKTIDDLNINSLFERLDGVKEVIIATNPTREGETTALFLAKLLAKKGIETSRIANGLPIGSNIDYADELTLLKSLEGRKKI